LDPTHVKVVGGQRADPEDWGWQVIFNFSQLLKRQYLIINIKNRCQ